MATAPLPEFDTASLIAFLKDEETKAYDTQLADERADALDFYNGEPFGDEEEGRSQVVTRDVAEAIDYMTISLLRTMVSGDHVVEFDHENSDKAKEATEAITRQFMRGQDGYRIIHDWIKAGLLEKLGVVKTCVEEQPPARREAVIDEFGLAQMQEQGVELIAASDNEDGTWSVAWLEPRPPLFRDYAVPNEEVLIAPDARDLDYDCAYFAFKLPKTLSQLAEMGFATDDLGDEGYASDGDELNHARDSHYRQWHSGFDRDGANRKVWLLEEYVQFDLNGDGVSERLKIHRVGNQILSYRDGSLAIEEMDEQPGVVWCPFPMQHRLVGQSLADKIMDIQRVRSVLLRGALDNLYQTNAPRVLVPENDSSPNLIEDLLTVRPGGLIRYSGAVAPAPFSVPFVAGNAFEAMEVMVGERESRTGITRLNQGLDADTLNKTATGTALMQAQGQQIEEYLARNFAEAFGRLMMKKYRLMKAYGQPMRMQIEGEAVEIDPSTWPDDMEVRCRVGLGSGRKEQRLQYNMMMLGIQREALAGGLRIVGEEQVYNTMAALVADANLGSVRDYAIDPATLGDAPERPDPEMAKVEAEKELKAAELQAKQQEAVANLQLAEAKAQAEIEMQREKTAAQIEAEREKTALQAQLARDKAAAEMRLAREKAQFEMQQAREAAALNAEIARENAAAKREAASLPKNRQGGDLDK